MEIEQSGEIIFGIRPIQEAINNNITFLKIYIQKGAGDNLLSVKRLLNKNKINYTEVPKEKLDSLSRFSLHQGIVAKVTSLQYQHAETIVNQMLDRNEKPFLLILDRITDVRNFGALARTALAANVSAIVIPDKGSADITQDAIKASSGALLNIPVCKCTNLFQTVKHLKDAGLQIIAATEKANKELYFETLRKPCAIILGNEESGIHPSVLKLADKMVKIPMHNQFNSLNVSVAGALVMYEVLRQEIC